MAADVNQSMIDRQQELLHEELDKFVDSFHKRSNNKASLLKVVPIKIVLSKQL